MVDYEAPHLDNTALFKARIKMLNMKQKPSSTSSLFASRNSEESELLNPAESNKSKGNSINFHLYAAHARQICHHIRELRDLVLEKRKAYLLGSVNIYGHDNFMSDSDRRLFDHDTGDLLNYLTTCSELAMKQCSKLVRNLELQVDSDGSLKLEDEFPHLKAVTLLLNVYLKNVCRIVAELRAVQLKKTQHLNRFCRLGNLVNKYGPRIERIRAESELKKRELDRKKAELEKRLNPLKKEKEQLKEEVKVESNGWEEVGNKLDLFDDKDNLSLRRRNVYSQDLEEKSEQIDLPHTTQTQLTLENNRLFEKFVQRNSEIELIESQVAEIQKLQRTFADKVSPSTSFDKSVWVMEQEKDIEIISERTIYTLDNLEQANEFIRDAIKNSASRRVIALFCLIVLTFTLLFIDWYHP